jgi:hypothetical protein
VNSASLKACNTVVTGKKIPAANYVGWLVSV